MQPAILNLLHTIERIQSELEAAEEQLDVALEQTSAPGPHVGALQDRITYAQFAISAVAEGCLLALPHGYTARRRIWRIIRRRALHGQRHDGTIEG